MDTPEHGPAQPHEHSPELDRALADSLALAIHLNAEKLTKRKKGAAIN